MLPAAKNIAVLTNPTSQTLAKTFLQILRPAANTLGLQLHVLEASTEGDIDRTFATLAQLKVDAMVVQPDVFFTSRDEQFGTLAQRYAVPTISIYRPFVAAGRSAADRGWCTCGFGASSVGVAPVRSGR